jgi:4-hydroxy-3-methylbut-2-enyl diphosphate reductase
VKPKIIVSKNAGYCMGVKRAFAESYKINKIHKDLSVYGEMVHNKFALKSLYDKGIILKKTINDIINDKNINYVIIRAHGIPPYEEKILKESNKIIYDFTCPKVKKVQLLANQLSNNGHIMIIFGKKDHPEVIGITGYCKNPYYVISNLQEAKRLPFKKIKKPALICQTTMNSNVFEEICSYLKLKFQNIKINNTLCKLPIKIQNSSIVLASKVDIMIVVGDKMSANTSTLYEKIKQNNKCWFIETEKDLKINKLKKYKKIGITGGTSTPQWQIETIKNYIERNI